MKMKNINKYFVLVFLVAAGAFASCEKSLDIPQQGVQSIDDFYKTDEDAMNALADLYTQWRNTYSTLLGTLDVMTDDSYGGWQNIGDNAGNAHAFNTFTFDATRSAGLYASPAGIVRRVNTILARVAPDSPVKKRIHAECHVIRAWAYSYLVQLFGGVPLFEEEITGLNAEVARVPVADIWAFVNKDFETAIASGDLPSKSSVSDKENILRITKEAAQAWYGKALLWQGKWSESATQLKNVINSGKYELMGDAQLRNHNNELDFGYVVRAKNNLSTEAIFEFNSKKDQTGNSGGTAYGSIGNSWRGDQLWYNGKVVGNIPELDLAGNGWGGTGVCRKSIYDAFEEMEGADGFRLKGSIMTWDDFQAYGISINGVYFSSEGYWDFKYRPVLSEAGAWMAGTGFEIWGLFNSWKPMRYAEVLLNAAEACIRANDTGSALTYTNLVRDRAHLAPLASVTLTDIKKEKRLELYREGSRYIDLVRWEVLNDADGITASGMLGEQGHYIPTFDGITVNHQAYIMDIYGWKKGKHELLPIPQTELNANRKIEQNPGY
ncbi:MAG: RagB/SusD family nutrient uptake outer membrane protein [Tannerellaceae bacterium]|jgi:hypothetical protein|nr:RagB/SusD family nutrient uptake outer membrane protein [Tannerellaceae bacterium]